MKKNNNETLTGSHNSCDYVKAIPEELPFGHNESSNVFGSIPVCSLNRRLKAIAATILTIFIVAGCASMHERDVASTRQDQVVFAVVGDMPYNANEEASLTWPNGEIVKAIRAVNPSVLVHYGDFKAGGGSCTDDLFEKSKRLIAGMIPNRTVYTPGDNDWTDCDRDSTEIRFDEMERLQFIRNIFFNNTGLEMTRDIPGLIRQEGQPENAMWRIKDLVMGTLHLVGTNNGRDEILLSDENQALDAVDIRDTLNEIWLQEMFESAESAKGLVMVFQADIYEENDVTQECSKENRTECDGHKRIRDAIEKMAFIYEKPVLVVHGDTNAYCFQHQSKEVANLWRLNGPGDFKVIDAAQVVFDPNDTSMPFKVYGLLDPKAPPAVCDYSR